MSEPGGVPFDTGPEAVVGGAVVRGAGGAVVDGEVVGGLVVGGALACGAVVGGAVVGGVVGGGAAPDKLKSKAIAPLAVPLGAKTPAGTSVSRASRWQLSGIE